jgi:simple sugar transport system permease protein
VSQFFTYAVLTATVASALGVAAPFLLAALGETMGQRSGVINLGVDGIMLLSAFTTYFTALKTNNLLVAILVGMGTGAVMGVVTAFISVTLKAEQGISGIGIYLFGLGNNGEKIQFNSGYKLSPAIKAQGEKLIGQITDGDITVPQ